MHNAVNEYNFTRDMGEVIQRRWRKVGVRGTYPTLRNSYPALTLAGPPSLPHSPLGLRLNTERGTSLMKCLKIYKWQL